MIELLRNLLQNLRRHRRITGLVLVLAVLALGIASLQLWKQYHLHAARQALDRYAFDEAQRHLNLCLTVPFRDDAVYLLAARTARRRDSYQEAAKYLTACRQQEKMTEAVARERLLLTAQQGELEGIKGKLRGQRADDDSESVLVLEALAKGYDRRCWLPEALECLDKLLRLQPAHPPALLLRARIKEEMTPNGEGERQIETLRDYEKAIELAPSFAARLGRAGALYRLGRSWDALLQYEQLRLLRESDAEVLLGLARCRYSLGQADQARRLLDELLERQPDQWDSLLERGRLALHAGQAAEAEQWLRRAVELAPRYEERPLRSLSQCLEAQHKDAEARRCRERLGRRQADQLQVTLLTRQANRDLYNVALRFEIADRLMRLDRERYGVATLYHVLEQQPRYRPAHAALADYYDRIGQPDRAARHRQLAETSTAVR